MHPFRNKFCGSRMLRIPPDPSTKHVKNAQIPPKKQILIFYSVPQLAFKAHH